MKNSSAATWTALESPWHDAFSSSYPKTNLLRTVLLNIQKKPITDDFLIVARGWKIISQIFNITGIYRAAPFIDRRRGGLYEKYNNDVINQTANIVASVGCLQFGEVRHMFVPRVGSGICRKQSAFGDVRAIN